MTETRATRKLRERLAGVDAEVERMRARGLIKPPKSELGQPQKAFADTFSAVTAMRAEAPHPTETEEGKKPSNAHF